MSPNITEGEVVLLLIKLTFLRCSWDLNIPLQSILLTLVAFYVTFQHVILINFAFDFIHEYLILLRQYLLHIFNVLHQVLYEIFDYIF